MFTYMVHIAVYPNRDVKKKKDLVYVVADQTECKARRRAMLMCRKEYPANHYKAKIYRIEK